MSQSPSVTTATTVTPVGTADPTTAAIERSVELDASPGRVWRALSEPAELASWFPEVAEIEARPGAQGTFTWEQHGRFAVEMVEVDPPRRLAFRWARDSDAPLDAGQSTLVEWTLIPRDDGGTRLEVRESGFVDPAHRRSNVEGWGHELGELVAHLAAD